MQRIAIVVLALVGCSKSKSVDDPLGECSKTRDPQVCIEAAKAERGSGDSSGAEYLYGIACEVNDALGCLGAAETYLSDPKPNMDRVREYLDKGCSLKNDSACKKLAAFPATAPPPTPVARVVPLDAAPVAPPVPPGDDKMTDLAYCGFMMTQFCTRCGPAHSVTVESCVKTQSADACAGLTGKQMLDTPADFRTKCAAAIATMDCNQRNGGLPPECAPPGPSEPAVAAAPMPASVKSLLADKMDDVALCTVVVDRVCARCGTADEMGCYQNQGHTACAALTGREHVFKTPAAFRDGCLAALGKIDCKQKDAGTPAECIPAKP